MSTPPELLYLNYADMASAGVTMAEVIGTTELALSEKGHGRADMPPKHWIAPSENRFFAAQSAALPAVGATSCKWQSGSEANRDKGLPYLTGLMFLNDLETGLPLAVMDSTWITAQRTAAATAVTARALANPEPQCFAILGCGLQGRTNLEALKITHPSIQTVRAFDISSEALQNYAAQMQDLHCVEVVQCSNARDALEGADIIVTAGPIYPTGGRSIMADWIKPGGLLVTLDYDSYINLDAISRADLVLADDVAQLEHTKEYGYFAGFPDTIRELGNIIAGTAPGRKSTDQTIISINMGIALEDVALARTMYDRLQSQGKGMRLSM